MKSLERKKLKEEEDKYRKSLEEEYALYLKEEEQKKMKKLQESMCPFSFVEEDEAKQKIKREKQKIYETTKEKFKQFKANPIKHTSRGGMNAEQIAKKENEERNKRIKENAKKIYEARVRKHMEIDELKFGVLLENYPLVPKNKIPLNKECYI